ncbi:hypothetical protein TNCV_4314661 [Trichonephila clavipes]|nr:hypothetical protein TNCV_4314661 [Trichonephila clavipes]
MRAQRLSYSEDAEFEKFLQQTYRRCGSLRLVFAGHYSIKIWGNKVVLDTCYTTTGYVLANAWIIHKTLDKDILNLKEIQKNCNNSLFKRTVLRTRARPKMSTVPFGAK